MIDGLYSRHLISYIYQAFGVVFEDKTVKFIEHDSRH